MSLPSGGGLRASTIMAFGNSNTFGITVSSSWSLIGQDLLPRQVGVGQALLGLAGPHVADGGKRVTTGTAGGRVFAGGLAAVRATDRGDQFGSLLIDPGSVLDEAFGHPVAVDEDAFGPGRRGVGGLDVQP